MNNDRVHQFIRQLMALPYLPKEYIRSSFNRLYLTVPVSARPLRRFMSYIKYTWITSSKFPVNTWSVFGQPVRTNNDVEGWHQRLNKKAKGQSLQLYVMTKLLSDEARFVALLFKLMISCDICTYSTRNHYMLFITLPETTICYLLLYQKPLYVIYYSTRNHYMLFITLPETTICYLLFLSPFSLLRLCTLTINNI
jgi:hypothetical protein